MLNLQDKLIELSSYNVGCQINSGYALVNITYPSEWSVVPPSNKAIEYDVQKGIYYYCAPMDSVPLEEIFESINITIDYNIELKKKLDLFQEKVEMLRQLFIDESYEALSTIEFKIKRKKAKKETVKDDDNEAKTDKSMENVKNDMENHTDSVKTENIPMSVEPPQEDFVPDSDDPVALVYAEATKPKRKKKTAQ